jgi:hypothetical protein
MLLEVGIGEYLENFGVAKLTVPLAHWAAQEMIIFSHVDFLGGLLQFRGYRWIGGLRLITAFSPGNNSDYAHKQV